jgi:hypothetical protein
VLLAEGEALGEDVSLEEGLGEELSLGGFPQANRPKTNKDRGKYFLRFFMIRLLTPINKQKAYEINYT